MLSIGVLGKAALLSSLIITLLTLLLSAFSLKRNSVFFRENILKAQIMQSVFVSMSLLVLFFMIITHRFEYAYVWKNSSLELNVGYLISSLWAGQEGSLLLFLFFQSWFLTYVGYRNIQTRSAVLIVGNLVQLIFITMLMGIVTRYFTIGSSPFALLKDLPENMGNPIFNSPEYLRIISNGNGLNPLLQNFWMMIHPPILFVGYAAALIPFVIISGSVFSKIVIEFALLRKWLLITLFFLGLGLALGGVWAYKALSFGGFWAWDPVENASLVPWIIALIAFHSWVGYKYNKKSYYAFSITFSLLIYVFVLYASWLTRGGILGQTSVHAFHDNHMGMPLLICLIIFLIVAIYVSIVSVRRNNIEIKASDESCESMDWFNKKSVFLSLTIIALSFSAFHLLFNMSLPVFNNILGIKLSLPLDSVAFYNRWQIFFANIGIFVLAIYNLSKLKNWWVPALSGLVAGAAFIFIYHASQWQVAILIIGSTVALISSLMSFTSYAGWIHFFFSMMFLSFALSFGCAKYYADPNSDQIVLSINNEVSFGNIAISYQGSFLDSNHVFCYPVLLKDENSTHVLTPIIKESDMGSMAEPDIASLLNKDLFLSVSQTMRNRPDDSLMGQIQKNIYMGDTVHHGKYILFLESVKSLSDSLVDIRNMVLQANVVLADSSGIIDTLHPQLITQNDQVFRKPSTSVSERMVLIFDNIIEQKPGIKLIISSYSPDVIAVKLTEFPMIKLLWIGIIGMFAVIGFQLFRKNLLR